MIIYKILRADEWARFDAEGVTQGAPVDLADGYIHFSTADQLSGTLSKHFAGESGLWLLECDGTRMEPDLKWETARGGALFPHLYRALERHDVRSARPLDEEKPCV